MSLTALTTETLLDVTVNVVPLVILLVFILLFLVYHPWGFTPLLVSAFMFVTMLVAFGVLAIVTYVAARAIQASEA